MQQAQAWLKQQERISAGLIKDKYPNVKSISIKRTFIDDAGKKLTNSSKDWGVRIDTADAIFNMDCPLYECVDGGFDLTKDITEMMKNGIMHIAGEQTCPGWQDEERVGNFHCLTQLQYEIDIEYSDSLKR